MGCDIHLYAEKLDKDGQWVTADEWKVDEDDGKKYVPWGSGFYSGRNYELFAILADVRNGRGFAGIDTGDRVNPIDNPRGLPNNVCPEVEAQNESWGVDGHSHSYFTLAELLAYDWTQVSTRRGVVSAKEYNQWRRWGKKYGEAPSSWCGDVRGPSINHVSNATMEQMLDDGSLDEELKREPPAGSTYTRIEWHEAYHRCASGFWSETIPRLLRLGESHKVRIVFWFDN